jgi:ABC-type antimicrobial peptide transport system permease subunit
VAATSVLPMVRRTIHAFDSQTTIYRVATMSEHMRASLYTRRMAAQLVVVLGLLGLGLAVVGLYGVLAYYVNRRRREIGVRMAIGAQANAVFWMIVRRGLWLAAIGIVVGMLCAVAVTRFLSDLLFGVSPHDLVTLAGVAATIAIATLATSCLPALQATRVDPIVTLRCE